MPVCGDGVGLVLGEGELNGLLVGEGKLDGLMVGELLGRSEGVGGG